MATTSVDIKGRETVSAASASARAGLEKLKGAAEAANLAFKGFIGLEIVKILRDVAAFGVDNAKMWAEQERSLIAYNTAIGNARQLTGGANERLAEFASTMAMATGSSRDSVLQLETFLSTSGRTEDQIRRIIEVASDMSVATGRDLNSSVEQLNKTFGGLAGEMGESIPEIKALTAEQLRHGGAVELLSQRYAGLSDSLRNSGDVSLKNLADSWKNLRGELGATSSSVFSPMIQGLTDLFNGWKDNLEKARDYKKALEDIDSIDKVRAARARVTVASTDLEQMYRGKDDAANVMRLGSYLDWKSFNQNLGKKDTSFEAYQKARDDGLRDWNEKIAQQITYLKSLNDDLAKLEAGKKPAASPPPGAVGANTGKSSGPEFGPFWNGYGLPSSWDTHDFFPSSLTNSDRARAGRGMGISATGLGSYSDEFEQLSTVIGKAEDRTKGFSAIADTFRNAWIDSLDSLKSHFTSWKDMVGGITNQIGGGLSDALQEVGSQLFRQKADWNSLGSIAVKTLADVLRGIGAQLAGLAVVHALSLDFIGAGLATAGAAAALIAAGAADSWAASMSSSSSSSDSSSPSGGYSGATASYQQQRDITVNVTVNTDALVGDGGIRDFALMLNRELRSAGVLGLA